MPIDQALTTGDRLLAVSQAHVALVHDFYGAFVAGDIDVSLRFVAPDVVVHVPGGGRNAGEYWGADGFRRFMTNIARYNGGVFRMDVPVLSVTGEHAVTREVLQINRRSDPDRIWTLRLSNWMTLRAGRLSELWVIPEEPHEYDEYWSVPIDDGAPEPAVRAPLSRAVLPGRDEAVSIENHQRLSAMYGAFWRGDVGLMRQIVADDVVVNIIGNSRLSGVYYGWDGYLTFGDRLVTMTGDKYKLDVIGMAGSRRDAWAVESIRLNRPWDSRPGEVLVMMHFDIANGRIVRMDDFPLDLAVWQSFFTPPAKGLTWPQGSSRTP